MRPWCSLVVLLCILPAPAIAAGREQALVEAVKTGHPEIVRSLLHRPIDVNAAGPDGTTALHWAAYKGDAQITKLLLGAGARANMANRFGVTPISLAAATGDAATVELLLKAGADVNAPIAGETPLMTAAFRGRTDAVRVLLDHGAEVDAREHARGQTALMWAAAQGHADVIRVLVKRGADIRAVSRAPSSLQATPDLTDGEWAPNASGGKRISPRVDVFTPLQFAVHAGQIDAARALLEAGASVADETPQGMNTLVLAIANAHYELAAMLVEKGADPNAAKAGFTALHQLVRMRTLNVGEFPHPVPTGQIGSLDLAKVLLAHGAAIDAITTKVFTEDRGKPPALGATAFLLAAKGGDIDMMRLLAARGANPLAKNKNGSSALMLASGLEMGNANEDSGTNAEALTAATFALELGGDVNGVNAGGDAPIHGAVWRGSPELIQLLVERGARLDIKNGSGLTPLQLANGECFTPNAGFRPSTGGSIGLCPSAQTLPWRRPLLIPLLRDLMTARGLKPEMGPDVVLVEPYNAGAKSK